MAEMAVSARRNVILDLRRRLELEQSLVEEDNGVGRRPLLVIRLYRLDSRGDVSNIIAIVFIVHLV